MRFLCIGAAICALALLSGCQIGRRSDGEDTQRVDLTEKRVFLGNVTLVNETSQFVLIKTPINQRLQPGIPLESFRDGQRSGELLFSPEQSFGFMTADITHGLPAVGDAVYLQYSEGFDGEQSPRMQQAIEQYEREQEMGFFERKRYERQQRKTAKKGKGGQ
jgi:hypothetical protein